MASAHGKYSGYSGTGSLGVCLATSGPGAIHLLNGLYDAKLDHQPVLAIVGQQPRRAPRRLLLPGGGPDQPVQRRGRRLRPHGDRPGASQAPHRPGGPDSALRADGDGTRDPERPPGALGGRTPAPQARPDELQHGLHKPRSRTERFRPRARRRSPQLGQKGSHARRAGCAPRLRRSRRGSPIS